MRAAARLLVVLLLLLLTIPSFSILLDFRMDTGLARPTTRRNILMTSAVAATGISYSPTVSKSSANTALVRQADTVVDCESPGSFCPTKAMPEITTITSTTHQQQQSSPLSSSTTATTTIIKPSNIIRWGIIGLGDVTNVKSGPPFWKCTNSALVAVFRRTPGAAAAWAKERVPKQIQIVQQPKLITTTNPSTKAGSTSTPPSTDVLVVDIICSGYDNIQDFLNHDGLDAVYVCTRPGTHIEIAKQCLDAGKAVYIEKPVGRCSAETRWLVEYAHCKSINIPLYTAYMSRAYERTNIVRKLLYNDRVLGDTIHSIQYKFIGMNGIRGLDDNNNLSTGIQQIPWRMDPKQSGGGLLMDVGCHIIDRIDYICNGPIVDVRNVIVERRRPVRKDSTTKPILVVEDYVHFEATIGPSFQQLDHTIMASTPVQTEGASVCCTWDFYGSLDEPESDLFTIVGTKGRIEFVAMSPSLPVRVIMNDGTMQEEYTFNPPEHAAQALIEATTNELLLWKKNQKIQQHQQQKDAVVDGVEMSEEKVSSLPYVSRGDNALRTSMVLDQVLSNYYGDRSIGFWDRPETWPGIQ